MKRWYWLLLIPFLAAFAIGARSGHDRLVSAHPVLPMNFEHSNHGSINCMVCHHDFNDHSPPAPTGTRTCILCHKETPKLAVTIEHDFHQLCESCHLKNLQEFRQTGPVRSCKACHTPSASASSGGF